MSRNFVPEVAMKRRNRFVAHHTFVIFRPREGAIVAPQQMIRNCLVLHEIPEVKPRRASGVCRYCFPPRNVFFHTLLRVFGNRLLMLIRMRVAHILPRKEKYYPGRDERQAHFHVHKVIFHERNDAGANSQSAQTAE